MATKMGALIWLKVNEDHSFQAIPESVRRAMQQFITELPVLLESALDKPVRLELVISAQLQFVQYCLSNSYLETVTKAAPVQLLPVSNRDAFVQTHTMEMRILAEVLTYSLAHMAEHLAALGLDTQTQLTKLPFNAVVRAKVETGEMKMKDLMLMQPLLLINSVCYKWFILSIS